MHIRLNEFLNSRRALSMRGLELDCKNLTYKGLAKNIDMPNSIVEDLMIEITVIKLRIVHKCPVMS